ncbi:type II toxin-antitoxin system PemK/MazF family toxin [Brachybacterium sp. UNK5269]|uniref:type II toxin-antitoxin system PemK/MazF family toxin n=1 Tax=Brachybacterium sp. UNK5269 TaxID=3408576 RepID=UPI003BB132E2
MSLVSRLSAVLRRAVRDPAMRRGARDLSRSALRAVQEQRRDPGGQGGRRDRSPAADGADRALPDRAGRRPVAISYAPHPDGHPDPGEVVWAWVPFEEDARRGKDRPVLVLAEETAAAGAGGGAGPVLVALMLSSRDRAERGGSVTDEHGATWIDIGAGDWDAQRRPSEVRIDRLLQLDPGTVRREGGRLPRARFEAVAQAVRAAHGWQA